MRKGVVDKDGLVVNVILVREGLTKWQGMQLTDLPCEKGDSLVNGKVVPKAVDPPPPPVELTDRELLEKRTGLPLDRLKAVLGVEGIAG